MVQTTSRPAKRPRGNTATRKVDKCTLLLPSDLSIRLTVAAHLRGLDRSELATELLGEALKYVIISLRGQSSGPAIAVTREDRLEADGGVREVDVAAA
jgi:hypothetical protein